MARNFLDDVNINGALVSNGYSLTASITGATISGTTITYTAANHGFSVGQYVVISGITPTALNLFGYSYQITAVTSTTFTVASRTTGTYTSGGTATVYQSSVITNVKTSAGTSVFSITSEGSVAISPTRTDVPGLTINGKSLSPSSQLIPITSIVPDGANDLWTITVPTHNASVGQLIQISGVNPTNYNGTFSVGGTTATTITVYQVDTSASYVSGGTIMVIAGLIEARSKPGYDVAFAVYDSNNSVSPFTISPSKNNSNTSLTVVEPSAVNTNSGVANIAQEWRNYTNGYIGGVSSSYGLYLGAYNYSNLPTTYWNTNGLTIGGTKVINSSGTVVGPISNSTISTSSISAGTASFTPTANSATALSLSNRGFGIDNPWAFVYTNTTSSVGRTSGIYTGGEATFGPSMSGPSALYTLTITTISNNLVTTSTAHGLVVGQTVTISGNTSTGYNSTWQVVSVSNTTQFRIATTTSNTGSGGTVAVYPGISTDSIKIAAGTATVPPLTLTSGTNLTTARAGALEFDGTNLYFTPNTTTGRRGIPLTDSITMEWITGKTYAAIVPKIANTTAGNTNSFYATPIFVPNTITAVSLSVYAGTTFSSTGVLRLGIYNHDYTASRPGTLLLDAGTVTNTAANQLLTVTISQVLQPGWYWIGSVIQSGSATWAGIPSITGGATPTSFTQELNGTLATINGSINFYQVRTVTSISAGLPSTATWIATGATSQITSIGT